MSERVDDRKSKDQSTADGWSGAFVRRDRHGRIALQLRVDGPEAEWIMIGRGPEGSLNRVLARRGPAAEFSAEFVPVDGYPAERAARLFVAFAQDLGAEANALRGLAELVTVSDCAWHAATTKFGCACQAPPSSDREPPSRPLGAGGRRPSLSDLRALRR